MRFSTKDSANEDKGEPSYSALGALMAAATAIPFLGEAPTAIAQSVPESAIWRLQYSRYRDWQEGDQDRITVDAPMVWVNAPLGESTEVEAGLVYDAVSGASPLYLDSLSGASGTGIQDDRTGGDVTITEHFERFSVGLGGNFSTEDDYDSQGANLVNRIWSSDRNTTFTIGANANHDRVRSTNDPQIDELRRRFGAILGVTQVLDKHSLIQSNINIVRDDGYLTDPYKLGDDRPTQRNKVAWLTRYRRYMDWAQAALHFDYRYYADSWSIESHTFEVQWYQPLDKSETWILRPLFRYYTQSRAEFYSDVFPPDQGLEGDYTADTRLSATGSLGTGLKLIKDFGAGYSASIAVDFNYMSNGLRSIRNGSPGIDDIYILFFSFGLAKRF